MSQYHTVVGKIAYKDQAHFDKARWHLMAQGVLINEQFRSEVGAQIIGGGTDPDKLTINIPKGYYRNLGQLVTSYCLFDGALDGSKVVWTTTDGQFLGCVAEMIGGKLVSSMSSLNEYGALDGECPPDPDEDIDGYVQYQAEVEGDFLDENF